VKTQRDPIEVSAEPHRSDGQHGPEERECVRREDHTAAGHDQETGKAAVRVEIGPQSESPVDDCEGGCVAGNAEGDARDAERRGVRAVEHDDTSRTAESD